MRIRSSQARKGLPPRGAALDSAYPEGYDCLMRDCYSTFGPQRQPCDWTNGFKTCQDGSREAAKYDHDRYWHADHWHEWAQVVKWGREVVICVNSKCGVRADGH